MNANELRILGEIYKTPVSLESTTILILAEAKRGSKGKEYLESTVMKEGLITEGKEQYNGWL